MTGASSLSDRAVLPSWMRGTESISDYAARLAAMSVALLVVAQVAVLASRSLLGISAPWLDESRLYWHGMIILFAAAWALRNNSHVRVDIVYAHASLRARAWVDLVGGLVLLLPTMLAIAWLAIPYAARAWIIHEGSREAGGLPLTYLHKSMIVMFALLMLAQGMIMVARAWLILRREGRGDERR